MKRRRSTPPKPAPDKSGPDGRFRCCGRFCYWAVPLGPWRCSVCDRPYWGGDVPKIHRARFWRAIDAIVAKLDEQG